MRTAVTLSTILAFGTWAAAAEPPAKFTKGPEAKRDGDKLRIDFAVSGPTDVTVWIEDAAGKTVRRIGAARLGASKVPQPFQAEKFEQSLAWDSKDDKGAPVPAGCRVKVALGLRAELVEVLGQEDQDLPEVMGIGVRPASGELYVLAEGYGDGKHTVNLVVLDREGKYLRALVPAPAALPWEKAEKVGAIRLPDGSWIPRMFHPTGRCFTPLTGRPTIGNSSGVHPPEQLLAVNAAGTVWRVNRVWTKYNLAMHAADGGAPGNTTIGQGLPKTVGAPKMALSPDGECLYLVGLHVGTDYYKAQAGHAVWRVPLEPPGEPAPFIGEASEKGAGEKRLDSPQGLAVDAEGRIHVADCDNGRIAQFDSTGKFLAELKAESPAGVAVNPGTGALYVLSRLPGSGGNRSFQLARYDGMKAAAPAATLTVKSGYADSLVLAADCGGARPVIWVSSSHGYCPFRLLRIEDLGAKFGDAREVDAGGGAGNMASLGVDRQSEDLFARPGWRSWLLFKGGTGKPVRLETNDEKGSVMTVGPDGARWWLGGAGRTGQDNKTRLPLPGGDKGLPFKTDRLNSRGFCVGPEGSVYAVQPEETGGPVLKGIGLDGKPLGKGGVLVAGLTHVACSPRVDRAGRLYILDTMRPETEVVPELFRDNRVLLAKGGDVHNAGQDFYPVTYGSILRFGPAGGRIEPVASAAEAGADPALVVPVTWGASQAKYHKGFAPDVAGTRFGRVAARSCDLVIPGVSPVTIEAGPRIYCSCGHAQFDIDGFDRLIVPDAARFQVRLYDCEGNLLHTFGRYGNADEKGGGADVPLAWGELVVAGHRHIFVGDNLNRRIMKVRLVYAEEKGCPAP